MVIMEDKTVEYLIVDTSAFIQNASLQNVGQHIVTCQEVVDEITNKRQLRRLVVLPYDLEIKNVHPENIQVVTDFAKKTGDYPSLSATDIKVIALAYQLEKEHVGVEHLRTEPVMQRSINVITTKQKPEELNEDITGFYKPGTHKKPSSSRTTSISSSVDEQNSYETEKKAECEAVTESVKDDLKNLDKELSEKFQTLEFANTENLELEENENVDEILAVVNENSDSQELLTSSPNDVDNQDDSNKSDSNDDDDDEGGWITPANVAKAKKQIHSELMEEKHVKVACMTTDFAMQNVLKQINLNVAALDGRMIKQLRTFILRCYACFGTTSVMTKLFCPKCGNKTLKRVAVTLDENGKQQIHINARRPLTTRGKKFSLPKIQGGKHSNNPHLVEDQPMPDQKPTRLARTKNNPLDDDYIAGFSPFVMRDVTSKSAQLKIRPATEVKHWMRRNPNEAVRRRKK